MIAVSCLVAEFRGGDGSVEVLRDSVYVDACHHWVPGADS